MGFLKKKNKKINGYKLPEEKTTVDSGQWDIYHHNKQRGLSETGPCLIEKRVCTYGLFRAHVGFFGGGGLWGVCLNRSC